MSVRRFKFYVVRATIVALVSYCFWIAVAGMPEPMIVRPIFVGAVLFLGFMGVRSDDGNYDRPVPWYDVVLGLLGAATAVHVLLNYERIVTRLAFFDPLTAGDWFFGVVAVLLVLELTRRIVGKLLVGLVLFFLVYTLFGGYFPSFLRQPGIDPANLLEHLFLSSNGLYGSLSSLSLAEVFMFIFLGAFLQAAGGNELFTHLAEATTKNSNGGPAKAAVIGSAMFGAISGSGVANVYATGSVTIPMMKRVGFRPEFAAAVEAVASSLGQIIPPIMGATAFIIAEYARTTYLDVAMAAIVPSFLYVFAVYVAVHLETERQGIGIYLRDEGSPSLRQTLLQYGHIVLPIIILIVLLVERFTTHYAATCAVLSVVAVSWLRQSTRLTPRRLLNAVEIGTGRVVSITATLLTAGLAIAILRTTGTPFKITSMIIGLAQGEFVLVLILVAVTVIILGMGLPPVGAFLIAAVFGAPALMEFGVDEFSAYMFIFLFGVVSLITPPVCLSSYAAASIAGSNFNRTGWHGFILGFPAYLIPFTIIHRPIYLHLFNEGVFNGIFFLSEAMLGIVALVAGFSGYLLVRARLLERAAFLACAGGLLWPGHYSALPAAIGFGLLLSFQLYRRRKNRIDAQ